MFLVSFVIVFGQSIEARYEDVVGAVPTAATGDAPTTFEWLSGVPDYFGRNKISSGGDLSHYSSASLY